MGVFATSAGLQRLKAGDVPGAEAALSDLAGALHVSSDSAALEPLRTIAKIKVRPRGWVLGMCGAGAVFGSSLIMTRPPQLAGPAAGVPTNSSVFACCMQAFPTDKQKLRDFLIKELRLQFEVSWQ